MRLSLVVLLLLAPAVGGCLGDEPAPAPKASAAPAKNQTKPPEIVFDGVMMLKPDSPPPPLRFETTKNYTFLLVRADLTRGACSLGVPTGLYSQSVVRFQHPNGTFEFRYGTTSFPSIYTLCQGADWQYVIGERRVQSPPGQWTVTTDGQGISFKIGVRVTGYWTEAPKEPGGKGGK